MNKEIKLALVDDHVLLRNALANTINSFENCEILFEAGDGLELLTRLDQSKLKPAIVVLDLHMPKMNGFEVAKALKDSYPDIKILMLTMYDAELTLIRLLQLGVKGFLKKDIEPSELRFAIYSVFNSGFYYSNLMAGKLASIFRKSFNDHSRVSGANLEEKQIEFLRYACSDMTYKEIAKVMNLTPRVVDGIRDQLFVKLDVKSRVGLAMVAIKNGIVSLDA